jgi:threonine aldolase
MADAEVGDDVYREDPTVRLLEEETAHALGKEAALFVPSGCMGNEIGIAVQTRRGDAILTHRLSHVATVESAAIQGMLGLRLHLMEGDRGRLLPEEVVGALGGSRDTTALVEVENTHNWGNGAIYPLPWLEAVAAAARSRGRGIHLDGARIWNASAATGIAPARYAAAAETVMVCYSKGLGAPVGSAVAGAELLIREARGVRKMFGGAMRQVGIIAAGALYGLRHHRERLQEDHRRARALAEAIATIPGIRLDPREVETNIVIAEIEPPHDRLPAFLSAVEAQGVRLAAFGGPGRFRAVTHLDIDDDGIDQAVRAIRAAAGTALAVPA